MHAMRAMGVLAFGFAASAVQAAPGVALGYALASPFGAVWAWSLVGLMGVIMLLLTVYTFRHYLGGFKSEVQHPGFQ